MIKKLLLVGSLFCTIAAAENESYIKFGFTSINDQIDVFNIKESEIDPNSAIFDEIGDMTGLNLDFQYMVDDDSILQSNINQKRLDYISSTLVNTYLDISFIKKIVANDHFVFSGIVGYQLNKANNILISDVDTLNRLIDRMLVIEDGDINLDDDGQTIDMEKIIDNQGATEKDETTLFNPLNLSMKDAQDHTFVIGAMVTPKIDGLPFNIELFTLAKYIKIEKKYDTSLTQEEQQKLETFFENNNIPFSYDISRSDTMLTFGINLDYDITEDLKVLTSYQYNRMFRDSELEEIEDNHIVDIEFDYVLNEKWSLYLSGTVMSNQFNGVIPYLYDEYTKTTFDHKYGWAEVGLIYKF